MAEFDYDLFVIGAGSGGVRAARLAAELGARVGVAEEYRIGGTCVIRGCVPKKLLVYGSRYASAFSDARGFGWTYDNLRFDWPTLIGNVHREVDRLNGVYTRTLEKAGVELHLTHAALEDKNTVKLANRDKPIHAKTILVATGGHPMIPKLPGAEHFISSNECFQLEHLPESIIIVGAGYISMEFASIFAGLGVHVTVLHRGDQVLRNFDVDLRDGLAREGWDVTNVRPLHTSNPGRVIGNLMIVSLPAQGAGYQSTPGDVQAYDVVTGKLEWVFHSIPHEGEFGYDTWPKGAQATAGGVHNWSEMTVDEEGQAAEHALLGQALLIPDDLADPVRELLVVRHERKYRASAGSRPCPLLGILDCWDVGALRGSRHAAQHRRPTVSRSVPGNRRGSRPGTARGGSRAGP